MARDRWIIAIKLKPGKHLLQAHERKRKHIERVKWIKDGESKEDARDESRERVAERIDIDHRRFYVCGTDGSVALVKTYQRSNGRWYLRTKRDRSKKDNLLALETF